MRKTGEQLLAPWVIHRSIFKKGLVFLWRIPHNIGISKVVDKKSTMSKNVQFENRKALRLFASLVGALREDGRNADAEAFSADVHKRFDAIVTGSDTRDVYKITELDLVGIANKYVAV